MNTYPSYKDSGVEWIGEIPSGWIVSKLKYFFKYTKGTRGQQLTNTYIEDNSGIYPVHSGKTQNGGVLGYIDNYEFDYDFPIIFTTTVGEKSMTTKLISGKFSLSQNCLIMIKKRDCIPSYIQFLLSYDFVYRKELLPKILQPSLRMDDLNQYHILVPPIQEQQQISDYLDYKTSKIDTLIDKTHQKIELLKEQRTSLINTTVTKGLNPNVEMKDSGVEWIGEIPSKWNITRLVNLGMFSKGKGVVKDDIKPEGHPCVRGGEVYTRYDRIFNKTVSFISDDTIDKTVLVKYKSILFSGDGETLEEIGKCIVYNGSEDIYIGGGINIFTPIESVNHIFLSYILNSEYVIFQKSREGRGQIVVHIYQKQLREIRLSIPPLQEQQQIVDYLDKETSKIDKLVDIESKRIDLLKEYRQSLISDVVTGKVDVRNEVLV